jgi:UDP-glucose 4-epimerase
MSHLNEVFAVHKVVAVIHFAALKAVNESIHKPLVYYNNNVAGTSALLTVMKHYGCKKIIFSSSATVYGSAAESPITEMAHTGRQITNPYGRSKYMCE